MGSISYLFRPHWPGQHCNKCHALQRIHIHQWRSSCWLGKKWEGRSGDVIFRVHDCPSFMWFWALLLHWGIGDRSWRLVLGRVSDAPQVPRCCHLWENLSTLQGSGVCALSLVIRLFVFLWLHILLLH